MNDMKLIMESWRSFVNEASANHVDTKKVKKKIENVFDSKKMFTTLLDTGKLEIPFSASRMLKLSGDPLSGNMSFSLKPIRGKEGIFLKGNASDLFSQDDLKVMLKLGVKWI
tara:strand:- start:1161 stop:1496 length:336 start_codon:yes stop_codon:yes gene_type:complete